MKNKYEVLIAFLYQYGFVFTLKCHMNKQMNDKCCLFIETKGTLKMYIYGVIKDHQSKSLTNYPFLSTCF